MQISIEVPVFKGHFLQACIDSVLAQTSDAWTLTLVWDGGDQQSRQILEQLDSSNHPRICVYFTANQGIARARAFLSAHTEAAYILPLDDDDVLATNAVERLLDAAKANPWASLIRAQRDFIDSQGKVVEQDQWFPFGRRIYDRGMVSDLFNQAQPYLIRRSAYARTQGWRGFDDFMQAGEDCDIFLQLEQVAHFELLDEVLYHYRLHQQRASDVLTSAAAFEMWRRLADQALARMQLPLSRISAFPPFQYAALPREVKTLADVDFVVRNPALGAALKCYGVNHDAILEFSPGTDIRTWKMCGFASSTRPLICFVDDNVDIQSQAALQLLVDALNHSQSDLVLSKFADDLPNGPCLPGKCLLLRREVILSTGGFDPHHVPMVMQDVDFLIQARRRGFNCLEIQVQGIHYQSSPVQTLTNEDLAALRRKWHSHADLLSAPLSLLQQRVQ